MAKQDRLLNQLNTTGLQNKDTPLYQVIAELIKRTRELNLLIESLTSSGGGSGSTNIVNITTLMGPPGIAGEDGEDGFIIPGLPGSRGADGISNIPGPAGPLTIGPMGINGNDGEDGYPLPGPKGDKGDVGTTGAAGPLTIGPMGMDGKDGDDGYPIPGPRGIDGAAASWALIATQVAAGATNYDFNNLSAYNEIRVIIENVTQSLSGAIHVRVSTDNGATFLAAAGDYIGISGVGVPSNQTSLVFFTASATAARSGEIIIFGFNMSNLKTSRSVFFSTDSLYLRFIPTTTPLTSVRVFTTGVGNLSGGTIYVFGR